jgi:hypothetical protein
VRFGFAVLVEALLFTYRFPTLFFCITVSLAVFTSRSWSNETIRLEEKGMVPIRYLCSAALFTILLQLILGATLRHSATWDQHLPTELVLAHIVGTLAVMITLGSTSFSILIVA